MPPRQRVRIGNAEGRLIVEHYQRHGALWDIIINEISRNPAFEQLPHNVQAIYNNNGRRNAVRRRVRDYVQREVRQGLVERINEMRYADFANPEQREEAHRAIRNRVQMQLPQEHQETAPLPRQQPPPHQPRAPQELTPQPPPPAPVHQPDSEDDELPPLYHENEDGNDFHGPYMGENRGINGAAGRAIPVPQIQGRRPYHALARENAEALNLFLTRELPVITHQMQQTMDRLDELIRRQMENQM